MDNLFYTPEQFKIFSSDLPRAFISSGFEMIEEPYVDYSLYGFRATFVRRYIFKGGASLCHGFLTSFINVVGLPFGHHSHKMIIISSPRNANNEPICDTIKLRVHFDEDGLPYVVHGDQQSTFNLEPTTSQGSAKSEFFNQRMFYDNQSNQKPETQDPESRNKFASDLAKYIAHIIEIISPGLIGLPTEMKLEILKKLSIDSIIKMSQVNNEFRTLIFKNAESLWRHLCLRDFNVKIINRMVHRSWMELYRDTYIAHQAELCRKERALPGLPERPALPPAPFMLQIGWYPEALAVPFYPIEEPPLENHLNLALELYPLRRADSLDSLN